MQVTNENGCENFQIFSIHTTTNFMLFNFISDPTVNSIVITSTLDNDGQSKSI